MSKPVLAACTAVILCAVIGVSLFKMLGRPQVVGIWKSSACEQVSVDASSSYYITREFLFTPSLYNKTLHYFTDSGCTQPFATSIIGGLYEFKDASHISFETNTLTLKAESSAVAQVFSQNNCGNGQWTVGTTEDVSSTGCPGFADKSKVGSWETETVLQNQRDLQIGENKNPLSRASD